MAAVVALTLEVALASDVGSVPDVALVVAPEVPLVVAAAMELGVFEA